MNVTLDIDPNAFGEALMAEFNRVKVPCQDAMADRVYEMVDANIGDSGPYRPHEWAPLSDLYAKRVKRTHATLHLTGEMRASVDMNKGQMEAAEVFTNSDVAGYHQYGTEKMPDRPFFPIANGEPTAEMEAECLKVVESTLQEIL